MHKQYLVTKRKKKTKDRNALVIAIAETFFNEISHVERINDRPMAVKIHMSSKAMLILFPLSWMQRQ